MWRFSWVSAFMTFAALSLWGKPAELPFLYELNRPVHQGSGGVLAAQVSELEWSLMTLRAPETRVELRRALPSGGSETTGNLIREGYAVRRFQVPFPLAKTAALRFETAFRSSGGFERIDSDGSSLHAFADSDWLTGVSFQKRFRKLTASAGGKWIRAKRDRKRVDHASAWDIQLAYEPNERWRFGVHARNLSGSDLSSLGASYRVRGETAAGVQHRLRLSSEFALTLSADARFPSPHAAQGSGGAVLVYQNRIGAAAGYMRRAERWKADYLPVNGGDIAVDERLWIQSGATAGAWARLGAWKISGSVSPVYAPNLPAVEKPYQWSVEIARRM